VKTICCIKECDLPTVSLGLCNKHWRRNKKFGSPVAVSSHSGSNKGLTAEERFAKAVIKTEGCWTWIASRDKNGYGIFRGMIGQTEFTRAHRYSYALHTGDLLIGMQALHSCDNPSCVNPAHLSSGTNADNMRDKANKGRARPRVGELNGHAILNPKQIKSILADPRPYVEIAAQYDVKPSTIGSVKQRKSWKHI
jgi:HNH endonuclease